MIVVPYGDYCSHGKVPEGEFFPENSVSFLGINVAW